MEPDGCGNMHKHQPDICGNRSYQRHRRLGYPYITTCLDMEIAPEDETKDRCLTHLCDGIFVSGVMNINSSSTLTLGSACVTSVMRLVESIRSLDNHDITVSLVPVSLWAVAEVSSGLVVCCLPLIPRLFGRRNARTRLEVSEPSEYAGLNSKGDSQSHNVGYDPSLHSNASQIGRQVQGESIIMKSVRVDQTSDPF